MRLDMALVELDMAPSRNQALNLIKDGYVKVENSIINKPSYEIHSLENINISIQKDRVFVSRAGEKLDGFIDTFISHGGILKGKNALDIGSSTGGFTQVLLQYEVQNVCCIDVGNDQLHPSLKKSPKLQILENTDIRDFATKSNLTFDLITCDVSFISLSKIISSIYLLCSDNADIILLFKPQFEVGKIAKRDKKGVVKNQELIQNRLMEFVEELKQIGFRIITHQNSKILGKEGNSEIFIYARKS